MKSKRDSKTWLTLRIDPKLLEYLKFYSANQNRSLSSVVRIILENHLRQFDELKTTDNQSKKPTQQNNPK